MAPIGGNNLLAKHSLRCDEEAFILCIKIKEVRKSRKSGYGVSRKSDRNKTIESPTSNIQFPKSTIVYQPVDAMQSCKDIPHLKLIALDKAYNGGLGGLKNADFNCWRSGKTSGLDGTYRAFLSNNNQDLRGIGGGFLIYSDRSI